jgi:hypothetical protein
MAGNETQTAGPFNWAFGICSPMMVRVSWIAGGDGQVQDYCSDNFFNA